MRPKLELLDHDLIERVLGEAFELMMNPGVKAQSPAAAALLASAGARIEDGVAHIP